MEPATATAPLTAPVSADAVLRRAAEARAMVLRGEADRLLAALDWALLHSTDDEADAASGDYIGAGRYCPLAGEGTPLVAEFAIPELAAVLGLSEPAAARLVGDALELAYRLPLLWSRVQDGLLPAWRARRVADHTPTLSREAAGWVDRQIAPFAHQLSEGRVRELIDAALLRFNLTHEGGTEPSDGRGVDIVAIGGGQMLVRALVDAADGEALESTVGKVATTLGELGDDATEDVRRSRALGILADPQLTLDLLSGAETDPAHRVRTSAGVGSQTPATALSLYVHVSAEDLRAGAGVARVEGIGPVPLATIAEWAGKTKLSVRPVIDLAAEYVTDAYEIPRQTREQILVRDPVCVFPWCGARTHARDVDHIVPFDDTGPPGQTRSWNLAPLCRFHHRLKTHAGWTYHRDETGGYHWRSPMGRRYTVTRHGTAAS